MSSNLSRPRAGRWVNLAEARIRARQARQVILDGQDLIEFKCAARSAFHAADQVLLKDAARKFIKLHDPTLRRARHRQQWRNTLRDHAHATLGNRPISSIDGALITETLAPIWTTTPETAKRVKQRIERVAQWVRDGMPLPNGRGMARDHHEAMPVTELPPFMRELRDVKTISARALEFTVAARTVPLCRRREFYFTAAEAAHRLL